MVPWSPQNKLWFGAFLPLSLLENWLPTPARSGSHCRGKWRQAASVSENLASLYKVQIPFQSVNSSKLIQPAQERNRVDWFVVRLMCVGGWSSWQALGATSVGEPVTQEGSLTLLSVRGSRPDKTIDNSIVRLCRF